VTVKQKEQEQEQEKKATCAFLLYTAVEVNKQCWCVLVVLYSKEYQIVFDTMLYIRHTTNIVDLESVATRQ
jgi:hypothetical protein